MKKKRLKNYYFRQINTFNKYSDRVQKSQKVSDIHKLRLSIKRIRTFSSILEKQEPEKLLQNEFLNLVSGLFKKAGVVRETQLNLKMISRRRLVYILPLREHLYLLKSAAVSDMLKEMQSFNHSHFLKWNDRLLSRIESLPESEINEQLTQSIFGKLNRITDLKSNIENEQKLHKIRKQIKKAGEMLVLHGKQKNGNSKKELRKKIRNLDDLIGKWHDYKVLIDAMQLFNSQNENRKVRTYLQRVVRQFEKKNAAVRLEISDALNVPMLISKTEYQ